MIRIAPTTDRLSDAVNAVFVNPYQKVGGGESEAPLPVYKVTLSRVLRRLLPFVRHYIFRQATQRAVDPHADLHWGPDGKGYRLLLHPKGVCLTGLWEITEDTAYSGYFRNPSQAHPPFIIPLRKTHFQPGGTSKHAE